MAKSKKFQVTLGILISIFFLWLAFRKVSLSEMVDAIRDANYWYFLPATVFLFLSLWFRAFRWKYFFKSIKPVRMSDLFASMMVGYMANNVFPMRLGEFLRAYSIGRTANVSKMSSFATIVVERVLDLLTLLFLLGLAFFLQPFPKWIQDSGLLILAVAVLAILFMGFLVYKTTPTLRFLSKILSPFPVAWREKILEYTENLIEGFTVLKNPQYYLMVAILSFLIWGSYIAIVHLVLMSFGIVQHYHLTILASVVVQIMIGIGVTIPSSPGYVGTYHYLAMQALAIYGVSQSEALSFAVVLHLFNYIPSTLIGLYYFGRENIRFSDALEEKELVESAH